MFPADKSDNGKFDEILKQSLQSYSEPVPSGFNERMLSRIKQAEQQRVLARIILQERLSLAGSIVLGAAVLVLMTIFPGAVISFLKDVAVSLTEQGSAFMNEVPQVIGVVRNGWQFFAIFAGILGFVIYSFLDLLIGDRLRAR